MSASGEPLVPSLRLYEPPPLSSASNTEEDCRQLEEAFESLRLILGSPRELSSFPRSYLRFDGFLERALPMSNSGKDSQERCIDCPMDSVTSSSSPYLLSRRDLQALLDPHHTTSLNLSPYLNVTSLRSPPPPPSLLCNWTTCLSEWSEPTLPPSQTTNLLRQGCPPSKRAQVWNLLIIRRTRYLRRGLTYASAQTSAVQLASTPEGKLDRRIQSVNNLTLICGTSKPQLTLRRVILAFLFAFEEVANTQLVLLVASMLLGVLHDDEEATFWGLVALKDTVLPPAYFQEPTVLREALDIDTRLFRSFLRRHADPLASVFRRWPDAEERLIDATDAWRRFLLLEGLPKLLVLRAWDLLWLEGERVLFRIQLAVLHHLAPLLTAAASSDALAELVGVADRLLAPRDVDSVCRAAFEGLAEISGKRLGRQRKEARRRGSGGASDGVPERSISASLQSIDSVDTM